MIRGLVEWSFNHLCVPTQFCKQILTLVPCIIQVVFVMIRTVQCLGGCFVQDILMTSKLFFCWRDLLLGGGFYELFEVMGIKKHLSGLTR